MILCLQIWIIQMDHTQTGSSCYSESLKNWRLFLWATTRGPPHLKHIQRNTGYPSTTRKTSTLNNLRLLRDPLLRRHLPVSGFTHHHGWSQAEKIIWKIHNVQMQKVTTSEINSKAVHKQKQHPSIFIPEQAQAVTEPTAVYYNCISH